MYRTIIHDDIVYSLKRWVFIIDLKQSIVLAFFIWHGSAFQMTDAATVKELSQIFIRVLFTLRRFWSPDHNALVGQ